MSDTFRAGLIAPSRDRWGWFVALGVVQLVLGIVAFADVAFVTLASVILIGALLIVGGVVQVIHAFTVRGWSGFLLQTLIGLLYVVAGVLIIDEPIQGSFIITLWLAVALIVAGIMRVVMAIRHRGHGGWGFVLFGGVVSAVVGVLLVLSLPWSSLLLLGTLIAIELVIHGIASITFGLAVRRRPA